MYHGFLNDSFTDGHLVCFQHLAVVNNAAMYTEVHKFFQIGVPGYLGYIPSKESLGQKPVAFLVF